MRRWVIIAGLIGIVAGLGSIAFFEAIKWSTKFFLGTLANYHPPLPSGEGATVVSSIGRQWVIPLVTTLGGLLSGIIVFRLAPEAEGHGTDAAIEAFHHKEGIIRPRIPPVKLAASAITIGSGGSAGREGPTAQIAAGFGSLLGQLFHLSPRNRRIAVAAGIGAGIGSIFKAPLGGAVLSAEILYLNGFEVSALIPSFIASVVGFTIFASYSGFTPIFGSDLNVAFNDGQSVWLYAVLGVAAGLVGILYPRTFYWFRDRFRGLPLPAYVKPAIGGLLVGLIALHYPQILSMGYGWLQTALQPDIAKLSLALLISLVFLKILATSLSIGSGGSGGVFAPGLFIGGMLGASLWSAMHGHVPHVPSTPVPFVVVGMMALFGAVARAPLAVMLMVGEMTGSYALLAPAMLAVGIAYIIVGKNTIYRSQVESPAKSPAHRYEYARPLLAQLKAKDAMITDVTPVPLTLTVKELEHELQSHHVKALPVADASGNGAIAGMTSLEDILRVPPDERETTKVDAVMSRNVVVATPEDTLDVVLERLSRYDVNSLPVVEKRGGAALLHGMISRKDISRAYTAAARRLLNDA